MNLKNTFFMFFLLPPNELVQACARVCVRVAGACGRLVLGGVWGGVTGVNLLWQDVALFPYESD